MSGTSRGATEYTAAGLLSDCHTNATLFNILKLEEVRLDFEHDGDFDDGDEGDGYGDFDEEDGDFESNDDSTNQVYNLSKLTDWRTAYGIGKNAENTLYIYTEDASKMH